MALSHLIQGSTGDEVRNLQRALNYHMQECTPPLKVDGVFGPKTKARTIEFQRKYRIDPRGEVGPITREALYTFVECSHHIIPRQVSGIPTPFMTKGLAPGAGPPVRNSSTYLPPVPRLQLPYPQPFRSTPQMQLPPLQLDPRLLAWLRSRPFEITAGTKLVFQREPGFGAAFLDVKARVWSAPIGRHVEFSGGTGAVGEARINDGRTEWGVVFWTKAELKDLVTAGPVDILRLELEGEIKGQPGSRSKPPDMSATLRLGPTLETKNKRFEFGVGGYLGLEMSEDHAKLFGGVLIDGTYHW